MKYPRHKRKTQKNYIDMDRTILKIKSCGFFYAKIDDNRRFVTVFVEKRGEILW